MRSGTAETAYVLDRDEIRYARSGDVAIAYATYGEGPRDLVFVHGFAGNIEVERESPQHGAFYDRLAPIYTTLNVLKWLALGGAAALTLAAVLQVSNTIRLAAMARRREIGIMRLVGASSLYIQLPFVLEVVFSALVGAALACLSLVVVMQFFVPWLRGQLKIWPWVIWADASKAMVFIVLVAMVLAVIPTLLMTRKYLKV